MTKSDIGQAFLNGDAIDGVSFSHNDYVKILSGIHEGDFGSLVTVVSLAPEPRYIVELESGRDGEVLQSEIALIEPSA